MPALRYPKRSRRMTGMKRVLLSSMPPHTSAMRRRDTHMAATGRRSGCHAAMNRRAHHPPARCIEDHPVTLGNPRRDKVASPWCPDAGKGLSVESRDWINPEHPVDPDIVKMIGNEKYFIVHEDVPVEIVKDKETREPEIPPPKRIRHPRIQIRIVHRRGIIRNCRRTVVVVVVVDYRVGRVRRGLHLF